jgi:hypothetical protein
MYWQWDSAFEGPGNACSALSIFCLEIDGGFMTQSKSRNQAESAFDRVQSQFFARGQAVEELQTEEQARQAKTQRLREARLARDEAKIAELVCS